MPRAIIPKIPESQRMPVFRPISTTSVSITPAKGPLAVFMAVAFGPKEWAMAPTSAAGQSATMKATFIVVMLVLVRQWGDVPTVSVGTSMASMPQSCLATLFRLDQFVDLG